MKRSDGYRVYIDVVEVTASKELRQALHVSTGAPMDCHMMLDRQSIPLLQGIGAQGDQMARECSILTAAITSNGIVVICPRES